jgi:hypothetical protein
MPLSAFACYLPELTAGIYLDAALDPVSKAERRLPADPPSPHFRRQASSSTVFAATIALSFLSTKDFAFTEAPLTVALVYNSTEAFQTLCDQA